jgi:hypothetical protein
LALAGEAQSGGKICAACGADVAGKARVRDSAGNYRCRGACETAPIRPVQRPPRAPKPAPKPAPADEVMDALLAGSPMIGAGACPACGRAMPKGAAICTSCGHDTRGGKAIKTKVEVEKAAKGERTARVRSGGGGSRWAVGEGGPTFGKLLIVFGVVFIGIALVGAISPIAWQVSALVLMLGSLVAWGGTVLAAFKNDQKGWGICGLLLFVPIVNIVCLAFIFYALVLNQEKWSRSLYLSTFVAQLISYGILLGYHGTTTLQQWTG